MKRRLRMAVAVLGILAAVGFASQAQGHDSASAATYKNVGAQSFSLEEW